jgi:hypothetical protein
MPNMRRQKKRRSLVETAEALVRIMLGIAGVAAVLHELLRR